jgi:hypothetical protein
VQATCVYNIQNTLNTRSDAFNINIKKIGKNQSNEKFHGLFLILDTVNPQIFAAIKFSVLVKSQLWPPFNLAILRLSYSNFN